MKKITCLIILFTIIIFGMYAESVSYENIYNTIKAMIKISANKYQFEYQVKPRLMTKLDSDQIFVSIDKVMSYYNDTDSYIRLVKKYGVNDNITILSACFNYSDLEAKNESLIITDEFVYVWAITQSVYYDLNGIDFTNK